MKQIILTLSIFTCSFIFSGPLRSETISVSRNSRLNISQAMDAALSSNSMNYLFAQDTVASDTINKKTTVPKTGKLKSPTAALVIALVPGAVVHGAGYFYAGKTKTAIGLFATEIAGIGLTGLGALGSIRGDTGGGGSDLADAILVVGLGLFVVSWISDVVGSPFAVKDQNDKVMGKKPFPYELNMNFEKENQQIKCLVVKHF